MEETAWYVNDTLGLKTLDRAGRLTLINWPGDHLQFPEDGVEIIVKGFLSDDDEESMFVVQN
jgi:hypothetical protein